MQDGTVLMPTTVVLPEKLVEKAVRFKINRAALFRGALQKEIEKLEEKAQGQNLAANRTAPAHPL